MPNGETIEIMNAIASLQTTLQTEIGNLGKDLAKLTGEMGARVDNVEKDQAEIKIEQDKARSRQWLHSSVIVPLFAAIHALLNHFGIKI